MNQEVPFNADGRKLKKHEREIVNGFLDKRDGPGCQAAPENPEADGHPCAGPMVIHHRDNNPRHNPPDGSNWQHRCTGHNHRAHPRGNSRYHDMSLSHKEKSSLLLSLKREQRHTKSPQMVKAELADRFFRHFIAEHLKDGIELPADDLLDGARNAFTLKYAKSVDQKTFEKALDAVCNPLNGDYENEEGIVRKRRR